MAKNHFMRRIVERFMDEEELKEFVNRYEEAKLVTRYQYTPADWKLFDTEHDIQKLAKKWGIGTASALRRIGAMHIIRARDTEK